MSHKHGDPLRFAFVGSTGNTSKAMSLFVPGSNTPYVPLPTDYFYLTSFVATNGLATSTTGTDNNEIDIVSSTGITFAQVAASTLIAACACYASIVWDEWNSEAFSPPQGVVPSVISDPTTSTQIWKVTGTGFVVHAPGFIQAWQQTSVPGNPIPSL